MSPSRISADFSGSVRRSNVCEVAGSGSQANIFLVGTSDWEFCSACEVRNASSPPDGAPNDESPEMRRLMLGRLLYE